MPTSPHKTDAFSAISDATRRALLLQIAEAGRCSVSELLALHSISQPAVSKHLRILRAAGLVRSRKQGRLRIYEIDGRSLREVHDWVARFQRYWDDKLDALGDYLDERAASPGDGSRSDPCHETKRS